MLPRALPTASDRDRIAAARLAARRLYEYLSERPSYWRYSITAQGDVRGRRLPGAR